ncbi:MAG: hypothetical protein RJA77_1300 [Pseudomonadota bacterium]|jgi:hypothetical protein
MQLLITDGSGTTHLDAQAVAWILPVSQADLSPVASGGLVGMARGVPVWVPEALEGARWLVMLQPNGDVWPARLSIDIAWQESL